MEPTFNRLRAGFPSPCNLKHETWEALELYVLGRSSAIDNARIEEHLLICQPCRLRLQEAESYVDLLRRGLVATEGLVELHATPCGFVVLRAYRNADQWIGRVSGIEVDVGVTVRTRESALNHCRTKFHELFPDHRCTTSCTLADGTAAPPRSDIH